MFDTLAQFYSSDIWRAFRRQLIDERTNKEDGILYSEYSGTPLINSYDIIAHHIKPLTTANVNDYSVSLNPENIMLLSPREHNEIHKRFGYCTQRKVYLVYGAPCSGKTSFVNNAKGNSDIIVDIDNIWQCVTGGERYYKPNALKRNVFALRECLLDTIKRRAGNWERAWIIEGAPFRSAREDYINKYGAELIHINADKATCLMRLQNDKERAGVYDEWKKYIEDYFRAYQE